MHDLPIWVLNFQIYDRRLTKNLWIDRKLCGSPQKIRTNNLSTDGNFDSSLQKIEAIWRFCTKMLYLTISQLLANLQIVNTIMMMTRSNCVDLLLLEMRQHGIYSFFADIFSCCPRLGQWIRWGHCLARKRALKMKIMSIFLIASWPKICEQT